MHYPEVTKNQKCRGFTPHPKAASDNPECKNPKQLKQVVCYFCINLSIQGTLHFMWNYIYPTPLKSTRLTKSTQFGNQQQFSLWSKRWKYNALRPLNFNLSILIIMKKSIWALPLFENRKSQNILFSYGEKNPCQGSVKQPTQVIYSVSVAFFPPSLKHWTSGAFNFLAVFPLFCVKRLCQNWLTLNSPF